MNTINSMSQLLNLWGQRPALNLKTLEKSQPQLSYGFNLEYQDIIAASQFKLTRPKPEAKDCG